MSETIQAAAQEAGEAVTDATIAEAATEVAIENAVAASEEASEARSDADAANEAAQEAVRAAAVANDLATQNAAQTLAAAFDRIAAADIRSEECLARMTAMETELADLRSLIPQRPSEDIPLTEPETEVEIVEVLPDEAVQEAAPISQPAKRKFRLL
jgi:seryl-tRNA synthetase